uniref:Proteasome subunit beta n=2 Tax=Tetraselmis sp. GSL018 TaxID=582737 RepID=A0A061RK74_9CHLO|mmetsp:Transcript_14329/g.33938  ORF Transcript_14329/g.33938 Transcript_14329/m.33938 type:complete len:244 (+) Transcript_14329:75-806(+)
MSLFQTRVQFSPGMQSDSSHSDRTRPTWSPYDNNGGTTLAVAGEDYCIVAASVRLATGFSILSRDSTRIKILNQRCVMSSSGFQADYQTLQKLLGARQVMYQHNHNKPMACSAMAQLLSNTLYYKRFFPYYSFNLLGGLDDQGKGAVYTYDAIGSYERVGYSCQGSGKDLIQPVLDNQLKAASPLLVPEKSSATALPLEEALDLIKDAFVAAGERDIYTGDAVEIYIITKDGVRSESMPLKQD